MSLVAYASSDDNDDSEGSEAEEQQIIPHSRFSATVTNSENKLINEPVPVHIDSFQISDEEEIDYGDSGGPQVKINNSESSKVSEKGSLFSVLPKPKTKAVYVIDEEADEFIKKTPVSSEAKRKEPSTTSSEHEGKGIEEGSSIMDSKQDSMSRVMLSLPKPKNATKGGKKTLVKIGLPTFSELDSDSDDEMEPQQKRPLQPRKTGSGLMGLLPQPHHGTVSTKDDTAPFGKNQRKKLIPYVLSEGRKGAKSSKTDSHVSKKKPVDSDDDGDSDEDSTSSFFSLGSDSIIKKKTTCNSNKLDKEPQGGTNSSTAPFQYKPPTSAEGKIFGREIELVSDPSTLTVGKSDNLDLAQKQNIKLSSGSSRPLTKHNQTVGIRKSKLDNTAMIHQTNIPSSYDYDNSVTGPYLDQSTTVPSSDDNSVTGPYLGNQFGESQNTSYGNPLSYGMQDCQTYEYGYGNHQRQPVEDLQVDSEVLLKLQGKRKSSKEPLNIIDVRGDQLEGNTNELLKQITEENEHQGKRSKNEMPKSLERRKHQITYLAFQAKERELELKNTWAANSQTRRQTQGKYGF